MKEKETKAEDKKEGPGGEKKEMRKMMAMKMARKKKKGSAY